jgi:hAT family C-terminal dimerisation region
MIEHLKKHRITQFPASLTPQTLSVLDIWARLVVDVPALAMSLEQAILA